MNIDFKELVCRSALRSWYMLSPHTQIWVSVDDLVQEGMLWVLKIGLPKWDAKHCVPLKAFLRIGLHNHFDAVYTGHYAYECRNENGLVGLPDLPFGEETKGFPVYSEAPMDMVRECFVSPMMLKVYQSASRRLQKEMMRWFFGLQRVHVGSRTFTSARKEFLRLAAEIGLDSQDCAHMLQHQSCLKKFSEGITHDVNV